MSEARALTIEELAEAVAGKVIVNVKAAEPTAVGNSGIDIIIADPENEENVNTISFYQYSSTGRKIYLWD